MGKRFLVVWEAPNMPSEFHLVRTKEKAQAKLRELIGSYIFDCIQDGDTDNAVEFIKNLTDTSDTGVFGTTDEIYIEELDEED